MSDLPEPWATWASKAGVRSSMTGIGEKAGVPASTISRLIRGQGTTTATVEAVAGALRVSSKEVLAAARGDSLGPWTPPLNSHLLREDERDALSLMIQRITAGREGGSDVPDAEPGEKNARGGEPRNTGRVIRMTDRQRRMLEQGQPAEEAADDRGDKGDKL